MNTITLRAVSQKDVADWISWPALDTQFPVRFSNGVVFPYGHAVCPQCGTAIDGQALRGKVTPLLVGVVEVDALGACPRCATGIRLLTRLCDDGRVLTHHGGRWSTEQLTVHDKRPWRQRLGSCLRRLMAYGRPQ